MAHLADRIASLPVALGFRGAHAGSCRTRVLQLESLDGLLMMLHLRGNIPRHLFWVVPFGNHLILQRRTILFPPLEYSIKQLDYVKTKY